MTLFGYEFTIKRKKRAVRGGFSRKSWTKSETDSMLRFRNEGRSWEEIGTLLGRTAASCYARYYKIKGDRK